MCPPSVAAPADPIFPGARRPLSCPLGVGEAAWAIGESDRDGRGERRGQEEMGAGVSGALRLTRKKKLVASASRSLWQVTALQAEGRVAGRYGEGLKKAALHQDQHFTCTH